MNLIPESAVLNESKVLDPIPEGKKVVTCPRCQRKFLVSADSPLTNENLCESCGAMPATPGNADAAATIATALGK